MIERWGKKRMLAGKLATVVMAVIAVVPPLASVAASFTAPLTESWSGGAYAYVLTTYGSSLVTSLQLAAMVVSLSLLVGAPAAWAFERRPFPGSRLLEAVAIAPLALPGISVAIAVMICYSGLRGHLLLLAMAQMLYTVPYVIRVVTNSLRATPMEELDAAARTLGASPSRRLLHVTLPLMAHPLLIAALMAFAVSWGEFNVSFLLATPLQAPFAAALYGTYTSNSAAVSGAATAIFLAGALPFLAGLQLAERSTFDRGQNA